MYHIILNPVSGRGKHHKVNDVFHYLDNQHIDYRLYETKHFKHPQEIATKISVENESGDIIVIGGDGTFSEVINGIIDLSKWNIGLIPAGSGNDFANCVGLPCKDLVSCLKIILKRNVKPVDYIAINDMRCINVLGTGIDVSVLNNFEKHTKLRGSFRYFYSLIEALIHLKWYEFDVSLDDGEFVHKKGLIITLCNGEYIGGGIPICPHAKVDDHLLEFVFVDQVNKRKIISCLIKLMKKKIFEIKETQHVYCQKAVFKDVHNFTLQIDGNIVNNNHTYQCEIVKDGLNMYL